MAFTKNPHTMSANIPYVFSQTAGMEDGMEKLFCLGVNEMMDERLKAMDGGEGGEEKKTAKKK